MYKGQDERRRQDETKTTTRYDKDEDKTTKRRQDQDPDQDQNQDQCQDKIRPCQAHLSVCFVLRVESADGGTPKPVCGPLPG